MIDYWTLHPQELALSGLVVDFPNNFCAVDFKVRNHYLTILNVRSLDNAHEEAIQCYEFCLVSNIQKNRAWH